MRKLGQFKTADTLSKASDCEKPNYNRPVCSWYVEHPHIATRRKCTKTHKNTNTNVQKYRTHAKEERSDPNQGVAD